PITAALQRRFTIELNSFNCTAYVPSMAHEFSCILHRKRVYPAFSVRFNLTKTVKDFTIVIKQDILKKGNTTMHIARNELNGCKFLAAFYSNTIYAKFFKRILSVSTLPKRCPIPANQLFEIRNYTTLLDEFPVRLPAMQYQMRLKFSKTGRQFADILVEGAVVY
ncbi:hypothetical protein KR222_010798, partial [Zaprionus bogoriensis]